MSAGAVAASFIDSIGSGPYLPLVSSGAIPDGFFIYTDALPYGQVCSGNLVILIDTSGGGYAAARLNADGTCDVGTTMPLYDPDTTGSSYVGTVMVGSQMGYIIAYTTNTPTSADTQAHLRLYVVDSDTLDITALGSDFDSPYIGSSGWSFTPSVNHLNGRVINLNGYTSGLSTVEFLQIPFDLTSGFGASVASELNFSGISGFAGSPFVINGQSYFTTYNHYFEVGIEGTVIVDAVDGETNANKLGIDPVWDDYGFDSIGAISGQFFATLGSGGFDDNLLVTVNGGSVTTETIDSKVTDSEDLFPSAVWTPIYTWKTLDGFTFYMSTTKYPEDNVGALVNIDDNTTYFIQDEIGGSTIMGIGFSDEGYLVAFNDNANEFFMFEMP